MKGMKYKIIATLWITSMILSSSLSGYVVYKWNEPSLSGGPVIIAPVISKPVVRPKDVSCDEALGLLQHYDNDPFLVNWKVLDHKKKEIDIKIEGNLFQRSFTQEAKIPVAEAGGFKFYLGVSVGTVVTVGAIFAGAKIVEAVRK
jgi:hypothetical protein